MLDRKDAYSAIPQLEKKIDEISTAQEEAGLNYDAFKEQTRQELEVISGEIVGAITNVLQIESSNGLIFKDGIETTQLNVTIYRGSEVISNYEQLTAQLGYTAYLRWSYLTDTGYVEIPASDSRLSNDSFTLTLSTADVTEKTTFKCELMLEGSVGSAELLAANQITIAKVLDGEQGIPGEPGADGKTSYFHIKYSAVANPTSSSEISETPQAYIGTYVDFIEADSTDPAKYTWSRFEGIQGEKGEQGIPGIGQDGKTSYLHIAYATSADGSEGFSISESANKTYIGQYTDFTEADSTDYTKYSWTKIKGEMSAEQIAQLNQASEDASQAKSDIANLEIGGRNLLLNSGFKNNVDEWLTYGITDYVVKDGRKCAHINFSVLKVSNFVTQSILGKLEPDTQYTMSAWVLTENVVKGTTNFACMIYHDGYYDNNGSSKWYSYGSKNLPINAGEWTHLEWTFTTDSTKLLNSTVSDIYLYARDMTGDIYFCDLKLEKGNRATDWTPAPEDVQAEIDSIKKRVVIDDDSVDIVDSTGRLLASYGDKTEIYDRSGKAQVSLGATKSTISGFDIVPLDGGHDYFKSDWEASDGNFYRTWIRSADNTDLGQTWAFSAQMKNQNNGNLYGGFIAKSNGDTIIMPADSTGARAGVHFYVTKDDGIIIYPNKTVSSQPNIRIDTSTDRLCYTTWSASSEQIKDEIKSIENTELNPQNLYDVNVVQFKYKPDVLEWDDERYGKELIGFIIEDLNEKYPIAVDKADEYDSKTWNWNSAYMIPAMLKLIQEQHKEIEELKELMKGNK